MTLRNSTLSLSILAVSVFWIHSRASESLEDSGDGVKPFATPSEFKIPQNLSHVPNDYREEWSRLTGFEYSGLHWNHFVVVYVNKGAEIYYQNYVEYRKKFVENEWGFEEEEEPEEVEFTAYEVGTIFLKEHYVAREGKPTDSSFITLMEKMEPGYDSKYGDWRYVWIDGTTSTVLQDGGSSNKTLWSSCIECHVNMAERDYVFATASRINH